MKIETKRRMEEATALSIPAHGSRGLVLTATYFVVVFSILVQSLTVGPVIRMNCGPSVFSKAVMPQRTWCGRQALERRQTRGACL